MHWLASSCLRGLGTLGRTNPGALRLSVRGGWAWDRRRVSDALTYVPEFEQKTMRLVELISVGALRKVYEWLRRLIGDLV